MRVRVADCFGKIYNRPRLFVDDIYHLEPGHHIVCGRFPNLLYEYHSIVDEIEYSNNIVHLIGLVKRPRFGRIGNRRVERYRIVFSKVDVYVVLYQQDEVFSYSDTRNRAQCQVHNEFNFCSSNLFATWCKLMPRGESVLHCDGPEREKAVCLGVRAGGVIAGGSGTLGTLKLMLVRSATVGTTVLHSAKVVAPLAAVSGVLEGGFVVYHTRKAYKLKQENRISRRVFQDAVATRLVNGITNTVGPIGGAVGGAAVGAIITGPAAPVGALVGGLVGGVVGLVGGLGAGAGLSAAGIATRDALESRDEDERMIEEFLRVQQAGDDDQSWEEELY